MPDKPLLYQRSRPKVLWYRLTQWFFGLQARVWFRFRCQGTSHMPATGPVILLSNHQSHLDPLLIGCFIHRPIGYLARATLFKGFLGPLIRAYDAIPIDREGTGLAGIRATLKRLKQGDAILMFPEGTRTKDGQIQPFMPGFIAMVRRGKATIQPVAVSGAFEAMPRGCLLPRPRRVALDCGEPISPETIAQLDDKALLAEVSKQLHACLQRAEQLC